VKVNLFRKFNLNKNGEKTVYRNKRTFYKKYIKNTIKTTHFIGQWFYITRMVNKFALGFQYIEQQFT